MKRLTLALLLTGCRTLGGDGLSEVKTTTLAGHKCPWRSAKDIILPPEAFSQPVSEKQLTPGEQLEDLACLNDLFLRQYAVGDYYKALGRDVSLPDRVQKFASTIVGDMSNYDLLPALFDQIHANAYDGHLRYALSGDPAKIGRAHV